MIATLDGNHLAIKARAKVPIAWVRYRPRNLLPVPLVLTS